ncbi:concanavalin A-like lectin/glucanase domain-containing protein [Globomyces pollinis-pini]|nr:concanavalin A-like lectin/glucanase domain-containing protein [Globomyces pollinis-pini]
MISSASYVLLFAISVHSLAADVSAIHDSGSEKSVGPLACVIKYNQCGGKNYQGETCCEPGTVCTLVNEYYSQCLPGTTQPPPPPPASGNCATGRVLWSVDMSKPFNSKGEWEYDTSNYNQEKQIYVPQSQAGEYIKVQDGKLLVSAKRDGSGKWKAARAVLKKGWGVNYRAEVTLQMDKAVPGAFPAIWMLPTIDRKTPDGVWPLEGEIDIFEYQSEFAGSPTPQTLHFGERNGGNALSFKNCPINPTGVNTLAVESNPNYIRFFCNGKPNGQYNRPNPSSQFNWPYSGKNEFGFILNYAIQPGFAKQPVPANINSLSMIISSLQVKECF